MTMHCTSLPLHIQVSSRSNVRCHFSGAEAKYIDASAKWVAVPDVLLAPPVYNPLGPFQAEGVDVDGEQGTRSAVKEERGEGSMEDTPSKDKEKEKEGDKRSTRVRHPTLVASLLLKDRPRNPDQAVALETAVLKVAAAREFAFLQLQKVEERLSALCLHLPTVAYYKVPCDSDAELSRIAPWDISRGNPLGRDRSGNEYWLLFAQRRMPLIAQGHILALLNNTQTASHLNPQVIMRDPTGFWTVHSGQNIQDLLNSISSSTLCERFLRENLIESLHYAKKSLLSKHLAFKSLHLEWVERHSRAESFMKDGIVIPPELDVPTAVKRLETLWAKFVEIRCMVHNGNTFRQEAEITLKNPQGNERLERDALQRRLKKMKDNYQEEIVEHHPFKGWYRFEPMGRLRELWCATSADRMHADPMVCQQMVLTAKRSKFLSTLIPYMPPPVVPVPVPAPALGSVPGPGPESGSQVAVVVVAEQGKADANHTQAETQSSVPPLQQSQSLSQSQQTLSSDSDIIVLPSSTDHATAASTASSGDAVPLPVSNMTISPPLEAPITDTATVTESAAPVEEGIQVAEESEVAENVVDSAMEVSTAAPDVSNESIAPESNVAEAAAAAVGAVVEGVASESQALPLEEAVSASMGVEEDGEAMQVDGSPTGEGEGEGDEEANDDIELEGEGEEEGEREGEDKGMEDVSEDPTQHGRTSSDLDADSQSGQRDWSRQAMSQRDHSNSESIGGYNMSARVKIRNSCANKVEDVCPPLFLCAMPVMQLSHTRPVFD